MNAIFSVWAGRIAPVFDTTREAVMVPARDSDAPYQRAVLDPSRVEPLTERMEELEVSELICGAISRPLQESIRACGIRVHPFVAGPLDEVILAWRTGHLGDERFRMPGCSGRNRHRMRRGWR